MFGIVLRLLTAFFDFLAGQRDEVAGTVFFKDVLFLADGFQVGLGGFAAFLPRDGSFR